MPDKSQATDWASDVRKYAPDADDAAIAGIVRHCGIALRSRDASLVSFGDKAETDRVRESFCKKKLGLTDPDDVLDAAIAAVGARMSDTTFRNRVTVYYLLAEHFGKLGLFSGAAKAAAPATPAAAPAPAALSEPAAAVAAIAPLAAAAAPAAAALPIPPGVRGVARPRPASEGGDFFGLAAVVFGAGATIMLVAAIVAMYMSSRSQAAVAAPPPEMPLATAPAEPALVEAAIPDGAGVVSEVIDGRPKVSVYFDVGMADIAPDFVAAAEPITAWLAANPDDRAQLSGFTDPTGNAEQNAALAKARAEAVAAALAAEGVAPDRIDLVKPDDVSDAAAELSAARRVEITVVSS